MSKRQAKADKRAGFNQMVTQITTGSCQIRKTRRGMSIFEDKNIRDCTQERTAVPMLKDEKLNHTLQRVIRNTTLAGTYDSVAKKKPV